MQLAAAAHGAEPWRLVPALGIAQIISWGALYYGISVLGAPIGAELGLAPANVFGAYSAGLLLSGVAAPRIGRAIDRHGGRIVMTLGSVAAAAALLWLSRVTSAVEYYAAWCLGGIALALTLYDPAFATLSQHFGTSYRRALTALTLFGGFASTVFWPLSQYGLAQVGWRDTLAAFAALEIAVCLPLHWLLIPGGRGHAHRVAAEPAGMHERDGPPRARIAPSRRDGAQRQGSPRMPASRRASSPQFVALASSFALNAFVFSAMSAHLIGMMEGGGITVADAVFIAALIGPMQVVGRIIEITFGRNLRAATVGIVALALLIAALIVLLAGGRITISAALVFAVLYGLSNGVMTIVRGTAPAEIFGRDAYGSLLGRLAAPSLIARAAAPVALAALATPQTAPQGALACLLVLAVLSLVAFGVTVRLVRRR